MSVDVSIDPDDPTPPYEQLRSQLAEHIVSGALAPGMKLAPVRRLAEALDLANGTVARAYRELEAGGLVTTRRGGGTHVLDRDSDEGEAARRERLDELAATLVATSRAMGVSDSDVLTAVRNAQGPT